jgi:hypothetical protein
MGRIGGRRLLLFPLLGAALAAALAAWLLRGRGEESSDADPAGRVAAGAGDEAPVLTAAVTAAARAREAGAAPDGEPALAGVALDAPTEERIALRLVDRHGRPLSYARVTVRVAVTDARGTRAVASSAQADADGHVTFDVLSRRVLGVEVQLAARGGAQVVASFTGGVDAAQLERADLVAEGLEVLRARTVDGRGRGVADRRVVYRPRVEGVEPSGWWGDRSDMAAQLVLGPFPSGSLVEIAPGPRSTGDTQRDPGPWQQVRVDGTLVEVNVGDAPRLRLRIAGVAPDAEVAINGRASRLENGIWTGPEVHPRLGLDVMVGPLADGRFAALRTLFGEAEPIDVELEPGMRVTGRVVGGPTSTGWSGSILAKGALWHWTVPVGGDGSFTFPGLPTWGGASLQADVVAQATGRAHMGSVEWREQPHLDLAVVAALRITGRVHLEAREDPPAEVIHVSVGFTAQGREWPAQAAQDGTFTGTVPAGLVSVAAEIQLRDGRMAFTYENLGRVDADRSDVILTLNSLE